MDTLSERGADPEARRLAQAVRAACIEVAIAGYERASADGLCEAGAWECAIEAIRALDLEAIFQRIR
ncbi:MAG TPA: hypothetical protein VMD08_05140 [Candidatus Baltobacteraceae bacterium]|nr:hypothetical protein [Candidatus Baltobacteraceae bacterium]